MSVQIGQFRKDQLSNYTIHKPILKINNEIETITNTQKIVQNAKLDFLTSIPYPSFDEIKIQATPTVPYAVLTISQISRNTQHNCSTIRYKLTLYNVKNFSAEGQHYRIEIDGNTMASGIYHINSDEKTKVLAAGTRTINHNIDGTKKINVVVSIKLDPKSNKNYYGNRVYTLLDIYPEYFQENQIYYIPKITLKLSDFDNKIFEKQSIKVDAILKEGDFEQTIATFSFSSCGEQSYDISFVPARKCSELHFKVRRNTNELSNTLGSLSIFDSDEFITIENKVNLLTTSSMADVNWIQKLGVQAAPGFTFIVNGELIRVGKSGTYMISDINIDSLAVVIRKNNQELMNNPIPFNENSDYFLLDYEYIKEV